MPRRKVGAMRRVERHLIALQIQLCSVTYDDTALFREKPAIPQELPVQAQNRQ
jgi:hypothetical protein